MAKLSDEKSKITLLDDWAGQKIPCCVRATKVGETDVYGESLICELDPHGVGQWAVWARGKTAGEAQRKAIAAWNEYDQAA
jgi:hypothetical protein